MKKIFGLFLVLLGMGFLFYAVSYARITGTNTNDTWCVGARNNEVCVDGAGNLIPTLDQGAALGSSSFRWSDLRVSSITLTGAAGNVISASSITTTSAVFGAFGYFGQGATISTFTTNGQIGPRTATIAQIDALVPDFKGAHVTVTNMTSTVFFPNGVADCISTGTAIAQWAVNGGTHGVNMNGCGSGQ